MSEVVKEVLIWGVPLKDIGLLVLGAIIGLGVSEYTAWRRRREDEKEKTIDIITDVVKFVTKANKNLTDVQLKIGFTDLENAWIYATDFFNELNFHSFHLKRLSNQDTGEKFENLMKAYRVFYDMVYTDTAPLESKEELEFRKLYTNFIKHCIEICKINEPIRTRQQKRPGAKS